MSKDKKQTIKCNVESCKFNNSDDNKCELDEIQVSCTCDNDDCRCNDETICDSFEEKNDDEEYDEEEIITEEDNEEEETQEYEEVEDIEEE